MTQKVLRGPGGIKGERERESRVRDSEIERNKEKKERKPSGIQMKPSVVEKRKERR